MELGADLKTKMNPQPHRMLRRELALTFCCGWFAVVSPAVGQTWAQSHAPTNFWWSIASSADGTKLVALVGGTPYAKAIWTSTDSGSTWTSNTVPAVEWWSVASSADGTKLIAAASYSGSGIYTSTDSGATWQTNNIPAYPWYSVASSADGARLVAIAGGQQVKGPIYNSTNSGGNWMSNNVPNDFWISVASSADGSKLTAVAQSDYYTTTNSGTNWVSNSIPSVTWSAIACSADGTKLVAAATASGTHLILTSTNSGANWVTNNAPVSRLEAVASSADGVRLLAVEENRIWFSTTSGTTWISNNVTGFWHSVASSADGGKGTVVDASPGGIWGSQTSPSPHLSLTSSGGELTASWIVPSTNFVLQQNLDLTTANWTNVTNQPALNLSNLQNQVSLPPSNGIGFYRLTAQ
jgi:hypothetical protein